MCYTGRKNAGMRIMKFTLLLAALLLVGCLDRESQEQTPPKDSAPSQTLADTPPLADKETQLKNIETQKEIAQIKSKEALALKEIEQQTKLKELELGKEQELRRIEEQARLKQLHEQEVTKRYWIMFGALCLFIVALFILFLLYMHRKNKLKAYEDNLAKYFAQKENEARVKISEKILDTIASEGLNTEQKVQLIGALHGNGTAAGTKKTDVSEQDAQQNPPKEEPNLIEGEFVEKERHADRL